jgi:uncharacterized protein (TIGR00369 family)
MEGDLNAVLGFSFELGEDDAVSGSFEVSDRVRQPFGIVHGGAYAALAETLASVGTYTAVAKDGMIAMGMSNNTTFLRALSSGTVKALALPIHRGSTTWVWDVTFSGDDGRTCAVSRVTIAVRQPRG